MNWRQRQKSCFHISLLMRANACTYGNKGSKGLHPDREQKMGAGVGWLTVCRYNPGLIKLRGVLLAFMLITCTSTWRAYGLWILTSLNEVIRCTSSLNPHGRRWNLHHADVAPRSRSTRRACGALSSGTQPPPGLESRSLRAGRDGSIWGLSF